MKTEPTLGQLVHEIVLALPVVVLGFILIWTTRKGTNYLIDPPSWLKPWLGRKSFLWSMLGKNGEKVLYYMMGIGGIFIGGLVIVERLIILAQRLGY